MIRILPLALLLPSPLLAHAGPAHLHSDGVGVLSGVFLIGVALLLARRKARA